MKEKMREIMREEGENLWEGENLGEGENEGGGRECGGKGENERERRE